MNADTLKFHLGQTVYHALDPNHVGIVTGILFRPNGFSYLVTWGDLTERYNYEMEPTAERSAALT